MKLKFQHQTRAVPASWSSTIKIKKRFKFEIDRKLGLARQQNLSRFPALLLTENESEKGKSGNIW